MAEGNYPFASTYITFSVGPGMFPLPPWPMRVACERGLNMDFGVKFSGNRSAVDYTVSLGGLHVAVQLSAGDRGTETMFLIKVVLRWFHTILVMQMAVVAQVRMDLLVMVFPVLM